jgi:hypothetical protein
MCQNLSVEEVLMIWELYWPSMKIRTDFFSFNRLTHLDLVHGIIIVSLHVVFLDGVFCLTRLVLIFSGVIFFPLWYRLACEKIVYLGFQSSRFAVGIFSQAKVYILRGSPQIICSQAKVLQQRIYHRFILGDHHKLFARGVQLENLCFDKE